jgi:hypothetical protein
MESKLMQSESRASRLRSLKRLLEYALAESREFGLAYVNKSLGGAVEAVGKELDKLQAL